MRYAAFDIGQSCGFAYAQGGAEPRWGTEKLPKTGDDVGALCAALENFLVFQFRHVMRPDIVAYARPVMFGPERANAQYRLHAMAGMLETVCYREGIGMLRCWEATVRSHFLAPGKVPRRDVKPAIVARCAALGWATKTTDEADSLAVLHYLRAQPRQGLLAA